MSASVHTKISDFFIQSTDDLLTFFPSFSVIICGDFNDFDIDKCNTYLGLSKTVSSPTRGDHCLDNILISDDLRRHYVLPASVGPPISTSDHCSVLLKSYERNIRAGNLRLAKIFDLRQSNIENFCGFLSEIDFSQLYDEKDVNRKCELLYDTLDKAITSTIPVEIVYMTDKDKRWMTPLLKSFINKRWNAYRTNNMTLYNHYKEKVKVEICNAKKLCAEKIGHDSRSLWKLVRDTCASKNSTNDDIHRLAGDSKDVGFVLNEMATVFASHLHSDSTNEEEVEVSLSNVFCNKFSIDNIDVEKLLASVKAGKSPGPDGIHPILWKCAASVLAMPLTNIILSSINTGVFPDRWKLADIVPIPKVSKPTINDFRPVSLLSTASKLLERIALQQIEEILERLYGDNQFAYRKSGSTTAALVALHDVITKGMDDPNCIAVKVIFLDLSKAFDKVSHSLLMATLQEFIPDNLYSWLNSYLRDRRMRIRHNSSYSLEFSGTSGVPQGSVLGPKLFAAYVGSLKPKTVSCTMLKFADDIVLLFPITKNRTSCVEDELLNVDDWMLKHRLILNKRKTKTLFIGKKGYSCSHQSEVCNHSVCFLGVRFACDLKWNLHFSVTLKSCASRLFLIRKLKSFLPPDKLRQIYHALIASRILYAAPLFVGLNETLSDDLERFQRRAHRIVCGRSCKCVSFKSFKGERERQVIALLLRAESDIRHVLHGFVPQRLAASGHSSLPIVNTSRRLSSFILYSSILINSCL